MLLGIDLEYIAQASLATSFGYPYAFFMDSVLKYPGGNDCPGQDYVVVKL
jgi:hypothetical protein